jgi:hypothetical protein
MFIGHLFPLIPPPRRHQVRCPGDLAPHAGWRREITSQAAGAGGVQLSLPCRPTRAVCQPPAPRSHRLAWAELLKRTFAVDVVRCVRWAVAASCSPWCWSPNPSQPPSPIWVWTRTMRGKGLHRVGSTSSDHSNRPPSEVPAAAVFAAPSRIAPHGSQWYSRAAPDT